MKDHFWYYWRRGHCDLLQQGQGKSSLALSCDLNAFVLLHKLREASKSAGLPDWR